MKKLLGLIFNRWVLLAVVLFAFGFVVWSVGPLVAVAGNEPLASERSRWIVIATSVAVVLATALYRSWRAARGNSAAVAQLMARPPEPSASTPAESADLAAIRERFERALLTLKRARFGKDSLLSGWSARLGGRYLYELPWYLIIGAPGSGKTTALQNCGLKFPLASSVGDHAVRGVGGTRHCDWWFTDQAVLIDTAGRFTTQDSDPQGDRQTWVGFLKLLARARPRQAVNGVLVTVALPDLLTRSATERAQHAATVRARLQELHEGLSIRLPVYLLVTKCDLMAGFMDYFATLDKDQRSAPWGTTYGLEGDSSTTDSAARLGVFKTELERLQQRLTDGLPDRLQTERDPQRRAAIFAFPSQFAAVVPLLHEFVDNVFTPTAYEAEPMWRGTYFISGTQEGTPIDRILGSVARNYRLERAVLPPNQSSGKSFFLARLLSEVVFAESGLAGTNLTWERRRTRLAVAGYALVALVSAASVAAWAVSYANNRRYVADVAERVDAVRQLVQTTPNRHTPDLLPIVPALEATRRLASPGTGEAVPWTLGFGLFQGRKLDSAARATYDHMLVDAVLPRLALRVEEQLRQGGQGGEVGESQYEALKNYLMLRDPGHFDAATLKRYVESDWDTTLARDLTTPQRSQLSQHLDALLAEGPVVSPVPADLPLVEATRAQLSRVALPQRVYNRMRLRGLGSDYPEFTIGKAAGTNAALVFTRASGKPLTQGVPGLFSTVGYHKGFQSEVDRVSAELADEQGWVLGLNPPAATRIAGAIDPGETLADSVRRIYLTDYASAWETFIADIRIVPLTSLPLSIQTARVLSAPDSPFPVLMRALSRETTLGGAADKTALGKARNQASDFIAQGRKTLRDIIAAPKPLASGQPPESIVDDRFAALRQFVTAPEGGKAPVDETVVLMGDVYAYLQVVKTAMDSKAAPPPSPVPDKVKADAPRLPEPARTMVTALGSSTANVAQILMRQNLSEEVRAQVGEFCAQAIARRYPVDRHAALDTTPADFAQVFGPGGRFDHLVQDKLAPYIDTAARPNWRFKPVNGTPLGSDTGSLPQFQRAAVIRDTFFPGGTLSMRLEFKPVDMDNDITRFLIDVDGQLVQWEHGPQIPVTVAWPGPRGSQQIRVQVSTRGGSSNAGMTTDGPWAMFRMFDRVRIESGNSPEKFRATFDVDGHKAVFDVTTSSVRNPFVLNELKDFSCPSSL
ncbi:MAG: type VI secretion system membrane subunit TssM [Pseudomonadota bacterium]|nr:type VI secretion system membrane subunit TssM [Pseudomonadota bacterium]